MSNDHYNHPLNVIISMANDFVAAKFPAEFQDKRKGKECFEVIEMVCNELADKHFGMLSERYFNQFADAKDLSIGEEAYFNLVEEDTQ